jgi:hypothetical protein
MSLVLQSSGGGQITIQEPTTASNFTQTLPAATGTVALLQTPSFATTIGVGGATPAASGAGITFPATQSASSDANTLDDYEEGSWTPSDGSGAGLSFTGVGGTYTKVGRLVTCQFNVNFPVTANAAQATITGLPYAAATISGISNPINGFITYTTANITFTTPGAGGGVTFNFWNLAGGSITNAQLSNADVRMTIVYLST